MENVAWDAQTDHRFNLDEIEDAAWKQIATKAEGQRGIPEPENLERDEFLQHLNLMVNHKLTHAAMVLFGKDPQKYFPYTTIRIGKLFYINSKTGASL